MPWTTLRLFPRADIDTMTAGPQKSLIHRDFSGGTVDFSDALDWSCPPKFPLTDTPPQGVKLPNEEDQSQA